MNIEQLVKMANQIESFFRNEPDRAQAVKDIAGHIQRFWDPRMRLQILAYVNAGGEGLGALVVEALKTLRPVSARYGAPLSL